jgi:hypothetical protein
MSSEDNSPATPVVAEVSPETDAMVEREMPDATDEVREATKNLVEAIKKRAQAELQTAGIFTRESYLTAVRQAQEAIEQNRLIDPDQINQSIELIQKEAEKNWNSVVAEIESFGTRLSEAAKAAWEKLNSK